MFCDFLRRSKWGIGLFLKVIPLRPILDHARLQKSQECLTVTNPVMRIYSNGQHKRLHMKCPLPPLQPRNARGSIIYFTITAEIHARSLANFYRQYADRLMNLKFMRRVSEREPAIRQFVIVKKETEGYRLVDPQLL